MQPANISWNRSWQTWVLVRPEPPGQFTAHVAGLPELRATAGTREGALQQVRTLLEEWLTSGQLVPLEFPSEKQLPNGCGHDPNDPLEQEFLDDLARARQADLERTLQEYELEDRKCSNTSSTPTT